MSVTLILTASYLLVSRARSAWSCSPQVPLRHQHMGTSLMRRSALPVSTVIKCGRLMGLHHSWYHGSTSSRVAAMNDRVSRLVQRLTPEHSVEGKRS